MVIIAVAPRYHHFTPPIVLLRISAVGRLFIICHLLQLAASLHHRRSVAASCSYIAHSHFPPFPPFPPNIVHAWQDLARQRSKVPPAKYWPCSLAQTIATDRPAVVDRDTAPCHLITLQKGCRSGRVIWFVSDSAWAPTHLGPSGGDGFPLHLVAARTRSASELGRTRFRRLLGAHFQSPLRTLQTQAHR